MSSHTVGIVCLVAGVALTARSLSEGAYDGRLWVVLGHGFVLSLRWALSFLRPVGAQALADLRRFSGWVWLKTRRLWARLTGAPRPVRAQVMSSSGGASIVGSATLTTTDPDLETQVRILREQHEKTVGRVRRLETDWAEWRVGHEVESRRHSLRAVAYGLPGAILLFAAGFLMSQPQ